MISRVVIDRLISRMEDGKVLILYGPRQAGKTTLLRMLAEKLHGKIRWWNGDEPDHRSQLLNPTSTELRHMIGDSKYVFIDEAQRIENIGLCLKLITDNVKDVKVIASGSSAFELANKINEPLTGRKWEFWLFPFSYNELSVHQDAETERRLLHKRMIYGYYPDVVNNPGDEPDILRELSGSYLYKDVLTWERIQKPDKLERLVQALALQVGSEVSFNELGQLCGIDNETVEKYISLLEKAFIVFRLNSFSRNLRNELKKKRKVYFYDNGIRNAVISQYNQLDLRSDTGQLWENFLISGRVKFMSNAGLHSNKYFWRTTAQQEIDYIEESEGMLKAIEMKWNPLRNTTIPRSFIKAYPHADLKIITPQNYEELLIQS
jgi:predicted AAA+ superfamily ATPase